MKKLIPYLLSIGIVALVWYFELYPSHIILSDSLLLLFFAAIGACAWIGGTRQGVRQRTRDLQSSEKFLDSVIENIPNMIFVKDAKDLRFVRFNQAGLKLLGRRPEELIGKNDYDFFPKEQADAFTEKDRQVLEGNAAIDIPEEPLHTPNGTRYLHTKKIPLLDKDGVPQYLLGISEDITEKKIAEKQRIALDLEQAARSEAEKNADRLSSLVAENQKLLHKANDASRAKSAFLANMSHEIRTPLGAMLGFAELASEPSLAPEDYRKYNATIIRNGRQLLQIVDEILDLSKVESEKIQIEKVSFNLAKLIEEVSLLMRVKAAEKGLILEIELDHDLPSTISSDPTRLRQILMNVIGNAIKFSNQGSIKASIFPQELVANQQNICFEISDPGIGISGEQSQELFQAFCQADSSTTRKFGGTGLGLFLSRQLARLLGGDVCLKESQPGKGSTFIISISTDILVSPENTSTSLSREPEKIKFSSAGKALIVDDSPDNRDLLAAYLSRLAVNFDTAENGRQAIKMANKTNYDLIFMDIQMPEMDGFEAVRILRGEGHRENIVALTAHAMKGDKQKCLDAGFTDYLCKPLDRQELNLILKNYLAKALTPTTLAFSP